MSNNNKYTDKVYKDLMNREYFNSLPCYNCIMIPKCLSHFNEDNEQLIKILIGFKDKIARVNCIIDYIKLKNFMNCNILIEAIERYRNERYMYFILKHATKVYFLHLRKIEI